jgi:hypothetical protein
MNIVMATPGKIPEHSVSGSTFTIKGTEIDTSKLQQEAPESVVVFADPHGNVGVDIVATDRAIVAQIDVPARQYDEETILDKDGKPTIKRTPRPFAPDGVSIKLWDDVYAQGGK